MASEPGDGQGEVTGCTTQVSKMNGKVLCFECRGWTATAAAIKTWIPTHFATFLSQARAKSPFLDDMGCGGAAGIRTFPLCTRLSRFARRASLSQSGPTGADDFFFPFLQGGSNFFVSPSSGNSAASTDRPTFPRTARPAIEEERERSGGKMKEVVAAKKKSLPGQVLI